LSEDILNLAAPPGIRIPYGRHESQFGDLRLPPGGGPFPLVISIHGGFWRARYDLEYMGHLCATLAEAGISTWNIEYRRLGQHGAGWPGTFLDVATAADYIRQLLCSYPLDMDRVITLGHSAGGHLALWLGSRHRIAADSALHVANPLPIHASVPLAGVVDLRLAWELRLSGNVTQDLLGGSPRDVPDRYAAASPAELLPLGIPQILVHGTDDQLVPVELSRRYVKSSIAAGDPAELIELPNTGHFELVDPRSGQWGHVLSAIQNL
jgi:acetyl esterase/lipase